MTARDFRGSPIALTPPAVAYLSVTADAKVPALFTISSSDTLSCAGVGAGSLDSVLRGRMVSGNIGLPILVQLVADAPAGVTIDSLDNLVSIHFHPGVSTVALVESAITASTNVVCPLVVATTGTGSRVLQVGDAFTKQLVTAVVVLDQTTYTGQFVATLVRARTSLLQPTGDSDPYLWNAAIFDADLQPYEVVSQSRLSIFPSATVLPPL
jgi:hypothetical protein